MIQTINKITEYLKTVSYIETVCIVGSFADGITVHDVDVLLIGNELYKQDLQRRLENDLGVNELFVNDDSISCQINGIEFDFALLSTEMLLWRAKAIAQMQLFAEHRNWCVGYWMPEGFLYDVKKAQILFDKTGVASQCFAALLADYEEIRQKLIVEIKKEIRLKSRARKDLPYYNAIARTDVLAAVLRLANLVENWELTSFKHIDRRIRNTQYAQELEKLKAQTDAQFFTACEALLQRCF